jgi:hypothetical protein
MLGTIVKLAMGHDRSAAIAKEAIFAQNPDEMTIDRNMDEIEGITASPRAPRLAIRSLYLAASGSSPSIHGSWPAYKKILQNVIALGWG